MSGEWEVGSRGWEMMRNRHFNNLRRRVETLEEYNDTSHTSWSGWAALLNTATMDALLVVKIMAYEDGDLE